MLKKIYRGLKFATKGIFNKPFYVNLNVVATTRCTQNCPMCNAELNDKSLDITFDDFKIYLKKIKKNSFLSCTISGGEPTLVKDMPLILSEAVKHFPFGVSIITNLYGKSPLFYEVIETALKNNVGISVSFDGFDEVADKLRGAKNVSQIQLKNLEWVNSKKIELKSKSSLTLHTVISNDNLDQIEDIMKLSKELGWKYSIAPVNSFFYQDATTTYFPKLDYSEKLKNIVEKALNADNVKQQRDFIKGILHYARKVSPKLCPYLVKKLKHYKVFLDPDGSVYLCDRTPLGNLKDQPLKEIFKSKKYIDSLESYVKCKGCWLECFVSPMLYPSLNRSIKKCNFDIDKF